MNTFATSPVSVKLNFGPQVLLSDGHREKNFYLFFLLMMIFPLYISLIPYRRRSRIQYVSITIQVANDLKYLGIYLAYSPPQHGTRPLASSHT